MEGLERWKERFGHRAAGWLDALGSTEALLSAATIADENPSWCFPRFLTPSNHPPAASPWVVHALGHPLLADTQRVTNDYSWDPSRPIHLVTGSNMAGKSTWLRCLGLNQVLARLGSPICAADSVGVPLDLATSMRVQDNLHDGVSFFMAELKRLREIVEHCRSNQALQRPTLCLLDEILQGTNSRERQIAVLRVVEKLMALQAWIAISTHDLELADQDQLKQRSTVVHFRERFETRSGERTMVFDYRMHPGATPTTNALALLEWVGLDAD
jgi:DNA mismatch repair ATPase MutS